MAVDQSEIVEHMAVLMVQAVNQLANAEMALRDIREWRGDAGVTFSDYDSENAGGLPELFGENSGNALLKHVDGAMLNKISGKILGPDPSEADSIMHHLENTTVDGGPLDGKTYWEVIQMVRCNGA